MVGSIRRRAVAVVERSRAAVTGVRPALRPGVRVKCACPMETLRAVEVRHHGGLDVELQAWLSALHMRAGAHPGDRRVGPALGDARRRLGPLERCLLPAVGVETVKTFL